MSEYGPQGNPGRQAHYEYAQGAIILNATAEPSMQNGTRGMRPNPVWKMPRKIPESVNDVKKGELAFTVPSMFGGIDHRTNMDPTLMPATTTLNGLFTYVAANMNKEEALVNIADKIGVRGIVDRGYLNEEGDRDIGFTVHAAGKATITGNTSDYFNVGDEVYWDLPDPDKTEKSPETQSDGYEPNNQGRAILLYTRGGTFMKHHNLARYVRLAEQWSSDRKQTYSDALEAHNNTSSIDVAIGLRRVRAIRRTTDGILLCSIAAQLFLSEIEKGMPAVRSPAEMVRLFIGKEPMNSLVQTNAFKFFGNDKTIVDSLKGEPTYRRALVYALTNGAFFSSLITKTGILDTLRATNFANQTMQNFEAALRDGPLCVADDGCQDFDFIRRDQLVGLMVTPMSQGVGGTVVLRGATC